MGDKNEKACRDIASKLEEMGIQRTCVQCQKKSKKLRQQYKRIVDHNSTSGAERQTFWLFDLMDAVLNTHHETYQQLLHKAKVKWAVALYVIDSGRRIIS